MLPAAATDAERARGSRRAKAAIPRLHITVTNKDVMGGKWGAGCVALVVR